MQKPDLAHRITDQELSALEKRIAAEYKKAADELTDKINAYFESFKRRDEETKALIGTIVNGREYTEQDYKQWRLAQIGRGRRFEALRDRIAERMTHANEVAAAYINDNTPSIYSLNRNYAAYTIETQVGADIGFDLWDEQTVKRLIVDQPDLMPYYPPKRAVKRGIDLAWGKRQITAQVTSGIIQGESIGHIADRLQTNIPNMNRDSAIRAARTAVTGAQNAGRQDSYDAAVKMGIEMEKQWLATLDGRTRHDHAVADGQTVAEDKPFIIGGYKMMFPGDMGSGAPGHLLYNCRCTMTAKVKGVDMSDAKRRARSSETSGGVIIKNMTYSEWAGWKKQDRDEPSPLRKSLDKAGIDYNPVKRLKEKLNVEQIIDKIGGGDRTSGSCSSVAFSYIGNRNGLDVTDFRGGKSCSEFSKLSAIKEISELAGGHTAKGINDFKTVTELLKMADEGKEYYLSAGQHSAIIRKIDGYFEYLELQSAKDNGFKRLTTSVLKDRFGCRKSHIISGIKMEHTSVIIDADSLNGNAEFEKLLGYINASESAQKKGSGGGIK